MGNLKGIEEMKPISDRSLPIQITSFDACVSATYSDSVVESVTIGCFFELQDTVPLPMMSENPEMECR